MVVLNKHKSGIPEGAVYIGRGSMWGNPFTHLKGTAARYVVKDRDEACDRHKEWLKDQIRSGEVSLEQLAGLHNKQLVCFCAPLRCHGDTLVQAAAWATEKLANK